MIQIQNADGTFSVYEKFGEKPVDNFPTNREAIEFCLDRATARKSPSKPKPAARTELAKDKENA